MRYQSCCLLPLRLNLATLLFSYLARCCSFMWHGVTNCKQDMTNMESKKRQNFRRTKSLTAQSPHCSFYSSDLCAGSGSERWVRAWPAIAWRETSVGRGHSRQRCSTTEHYKTRPSAGQMTESCCWFRCFDELSADRSAARLCWVGVDIFDSAPSVTTNRPMIAYMETQFARLHMLVTCA